VKGEAGVRQAGQAEPARDEIVAAYCAMRLQTRKIPSAPGRAWRVRRATEALRFGRGIARGGSEWRERL